MRIQQAAVGSQKTCSKACRLKHRQNLARARREESLEERRRDERARQHESCAKRRNEDKIEEGAPISDLKRAWRTIRELAGLDGLRIHDLRHHAGEGLATLGFNEAFISKLLGHKDHSVTRRYIDVAMSPLHEAAERYGETVAAVARRKNLNSPRRQMRKGRDVLAAA